MPKGSSISLFTLIGVLCATLTGAPALDETKYPVWKGQWVRADGAEAAPWDARKPWGLGQQPPLIPEYQALFEANLKQLAAGVKTSDPATRCIPAAMPRVMMAIQPTCSAIETFDRSRSMMADRSTKSVAPTDS